MTGRPDLSHFDAIQRRLWNERARLASCRPKDRAFREHECRMIEKELAGERRFLAARGVTIPEDVPAEIAALSDDELLAELADIGAVLGL